MDALQVLKSSGLSLPTPAYLIGMLLFSLVGMVAWWHGKRSERPTVKWLGLALMLYPYVVPQTWLLYVVGAALTAWTVWSWNA
jgi:hypothetical protein